MPSRFEPCGLNQMYSLRYGTVPVVRATGGLDDTVTRLRSETAGPGTGFKFDEYTAEALLGAARRALDGVRATGRSGDEFSRPAMRQDFSWDAIGPGVRQSI